MSTNEDQKYLEAQRVALEARNTNVGVVEWDRGMHRIFKGIASRAERHSVLRRIQQRIENGTWPPKARTRPCGPISTREDNPRKRRGPGGGGKREAGPRR